jgi:hypothetical protein
MKLLSTLIAGLLAIGPAAKATPTQAELAAEIKQHSDLLALVEALGVQVLYAPTYPCDQGWYGGYLVTGDELVLCEVGTPQEKLNTVRHEAWHVYQDIRDCKLKDAVALSPVFTQGVVTDEYIAFAAKNYNPNLVASEAEAFWAAYTLDAEQINVLLYNKAKSCGFRF